MKPPEYRNTHIVQQLTPYRIAGPAAASGASSSGGLLDIGRVLWMTCDLEDPGLSVTVYAHGLGLLEIDRRLLARRPAARKAPGPSALRETLDR